MDIYKMNYELQEALDKLEVTCAKTTSVMNNFFGILNRVYTGCCKEAIQNNYSNNWLKMHGYPMRRHKF